MKPHEIIQELGTQRGRLFKESVLSNFLHDKEFQQGLDMALSPFTTFSVAKIPISKQDGFGVGPDYGWTSPTGGGHEMAYGQRHQGLHEPGNQELYRGRPGRGAGGHPEGIQALPDI